MISVSHAGTKFVESTIFRNSSPASIFHWLSVTSVLLDINDESMSFFRILFATYSLISVCLIVEVWPKDVLENPDSAAFEGGHHQTTPVTYKQVVNESVQVNRLFGHDCSPWMFHNKTSGKCECSEVPNHAVLCDATIPRTYILDCYCMTFNPQQNSTELGRCLSGCGHKTEAAYYELPQKTSDLNDYTCGQANRDSSLCSKCKSGYSPLVYSYDMICMNCTGMMYNWIKYIAVAYIPLTFFFYLVVISGFSGTSPLLRGFISICQGIVAPFSVRAYLSVVLKTKSPYEPYVRALGSIYGIWNLDFFRTVLPRICLNIDPLQVLVLDYAVAFYPLFLVIITTILIKLHSRDVGIIVWIWKPFHKMFHLIRGDWSYLEGSVVKAFATFFLLSYLKILDVTADLLIYTDKSVLHFDDQNYKVERVLYYDASVEYFGDEHLYYGITAILVGIFIVILPLIFLLIYPMRWFQKCLNRFKIQRQSIDVFVSCYQGHYKDGTNGTKNLRCFSIVFFLGQIILFCVFMYSKSIYFYPVASITLVLIVFIILGVQPYKEQFKVYSLTDSFMVLALATFNMLNIAADEAELKAPYFIDLTHFILGITSLVPLLYFFFLCCWWILVKKLRQKLSSFRVLNSLVH